MAAGSALAATVTGAGTEIADVMLAGLVTGAAVGAAQSTLLARGRRAAAAWTGSPRPLGRSAGWQRRQVIVDIERGHHVFGASGAAIATLLTGLTLRRVA